MRLFQTIIVTLVISSGGFVLTIPIPQPIPTNSFKIPDLSKVVQYAGKALPSNEKASGGTFWGKLKVPAAKALRRVMNYRPAVDYTKDFHRIAKSRTNTLEKVDTNGMPWARWNPNEGYEYFNMLQLRHRENINRLIASGFLLVDQQTGQLFKQDKSGKISPFTSTDMEAYEEIIKAITRKDYGMVEDKGQFDGSLMEKYKDKQVDIPYDSLWGRPLSEEDQIWQDSILAQYFNLTIPEDKLDYEFPDLIDIEDVAQDGAETLGIPEQEIINFVLAPGENPSFPLSEEELAQLSSLSDPEAFEAWLSSFPKEKQEIYINSLLSGPGPVSTSYDTFNMPMGVPEEFEIQASDSAVLSTSITPSELSDSSQSAGPVPTQKSISVSKDPTAAVSEADEPPRVPEGTNYSAANSEFKFDWSDRKNDGILNVNPAIAKWRESLLFPSVTKPIKKDNDYVLEDW